MPVLIFSQALTANQTGFNPLTGWQYEFLPWPAIIKLLARATTTGVKLTIYTGSTTIGQRAPVQGGGTIGTTPSDLNTPPTLWIGGAGDRLLCLFDEVLGGTPTVDGQIIVEPA